MHDLRLESVKSEMFEGIICKNFLFYFIDGREGKYESKNEEGSVSVTSSADANWLMVSKLATASTSIANCLN